MKEQKTISLDAKIRSTKINIVLWSIIAVIWIGLGIARLASSDELWLVIVNFGVGALSVVDVILNILNLKKLQKQLLEQEKEKTE